MIASLNMVWIGTVSNKRLWLKKKLILVQTTWPVMKRRLVNKLRKKLQKKKPQKKV